MKDPTMWDHLLESPPTLGQRLAKQRARLKEWWRYSVVERVVKSVWDYMPLYVIATIILLGTGVYQYLSMRADEEKAAEQAKEAKAKVEVEARYQMLWEKEPPKSEKRWKAWKKKFLGKKADKKFNFDCVGWHNFEWAKDDPDHDATYTLKCLIAKKDELPHKQVACNQWGCHMIPVVKGGD